MAELQTDSWAPIGWPDSPSAPFHYKVKLSHRFRRACLMLSFCAVMPWGKTVLFSSQHELPRTGAAAAFFTKAGHFCAAHPNIEGPKTSNPISPSRSVALRQVGQPYFHRRISLLAPFVSSLCVLVDGEACVAEQPFNPLKLKGAFWETGKLYRKQDFEEQEPKSVAALLEEIKPYCNVLKQLKDAAQQGDFEQVKTQLRGGNFSEARLRTRAKLALKLLAKQETTVEDDTKFLAAENEFFKVGQELNVLNAEIDAATVDFSRGVVGLAINEANRATKDQEDLSWNIVASLGGTAKSLERFIFLAADAMDK